MFREEMRVLGLPGAEDVTDGSVDYYDMDWENVENGVTEEQMAKCIAKECACTPRCKCSGNLPDQSDDEAYEMRQAARKMIEKGKKHGKILLHPLRCRQYASGL